MFYSKRKLVSLYEEKTNIHTSKEGLYLKEATRQDYLPIIENKNGTMIYRSYMVSLLSLDLSKLSYGYLESLYVEEDSFIKVLEIYYQVFHHRITKEEGLQKINSLSLDIQDGFTYCDSVYQKELF